MADLTRVLIVGAGSIGERHVRCFQRTRRAHVSLCESDPSVRRRVADEYGIREVFDDFARAAESSPEAAVICTPAHLHVPMATRLAAAGTHLLIEKPLSTSLDGLDELFAAVRSAAITAPTSGQPAIGGAAISQPARVAGVAYVYRSHPALAAMRAAVRAGRFGRPLELVYVGGEHFPYFRPAFRQIYYARRETGGGAIQDGLTHMINAGEWLVGPVTEVVADCARLRLQGVDVEDTVHVIARHGAVMASYCLNQHQAPSENAITVIGDEGTARCEFHKRRWLSQSQPGGDWHVESEFAIERDDIFIAQANGFLDAVGGRGSVTCTLEEAAQTLRVNLAVLESCARRSWQSVA